MRKRLVLIGAAVTTVLVAVLASPAAQAMTYN